jgi:beta-lactamase class A
MRIALGPPFYSIRKICMPTRFALALGLMFLLTSCAVPQADTGTATKDMPFLSRRILAPDPNDTIINLHPLRMQMREFINQEHHKEHMGVYFEYLPSGSSIGINDDQPFIAASLLKVPVAIKVFQFKEEGLLSLETKVRVEPQDIDPDFGTLWKEGAGSEHTVREYVEHMLEESDNTSLRVLGRVLEGIRPTYLNEVFDDLDLPKIRKNNALVITAKNYTSILRMLYLSSALKKENAQDILNMLTQGDTNNGLRGGVPRTVPVAHKIGYYEGDTPTYSDCGIVYVPKRPYALCMISQGSHDHTVEDMETLSRMAYNFIVQAEAQTY